MKFAIIVDSKVKEIIELQTELEVQEKAKTCEAIVDVSSLDPLPPIGSEYDGAKIISSLTPSKKITRLAFRNRFTQVERATMYGVAAQNNALGFAFRDYLDSVTTATFIDLSRPDTIASVNALVPGIISSARALEILNNPIQDHEKFKE